jgi:hypothetical protein
MESKDLVKRELKKIARVLEGATDKELRVVVIAIYKRKDKKVRLVNINNGIGDLLRGRYN